MPVQIDVDHLSAVVEDYLKAIYALSDGDPVGTSELARELDVAPATVTSMTKRLATAGLLERVPYKGVALTRSGRDAAVSLIRRHRLIELFLHKILGIEWDLVHDEAERWEHVISKGVEARIDALLEYPTHDPHGAPIPSADLSYVASRRIALGSLSKGNRSTISEVEDSDPALLRYVGRLGLYPGVRFVVVEDPPFDSGPIVIQLVDDQKQPRIVVDGRVAHSVFVVPA